MTVILVNRALTATHTTNVNLANFTIANGNYVTKQLSGLPSTETFVSNTTNALQTGAATVSNNSLNISLPALSTTAIILKGTAVTGMQSTVNSNQVLVYPNPAQEIINVALRQAQGDNAILLISDVLGNTVKQSVIYNSKSIINTTDLQNGVYFISVKDFQQKTIATQKIIVQH